MILDRGLDIGPHLQNKKSLRRFETLQPLRLSLANVMIPVWRVKEAFGGSNHLALRACFLDI